MSNKLTEDIKWPPPSNPSPSPLPRKGTIVFDSDDLTPCTCGYTTFTIEQWAPTYCPNILEFVLITCLQCNKHTGGALVWRGTKLTDRWNELINI